MITNGVLKKIMAKKAIETIPEKMFWQEFLKVSEEILDGKKFVINAENKKIVATIFRYFAGSEHFNEFGLIKNNPDLNKGLLISGNIGVGKTLLMEIFQKTGIQIYKKYGIKRTLFTRGISCGNFVSDFMNSTKISTDFNLKSYEKGTLFIDDLGVETLAFNQYELLEKVLFERYRNEAKSFITTNLTMLEILERYGVRVADRLPEMCNIINWRGTSFRTNL
ncbi:P-loop NTPase family protein [Tenacibaculum piscium]|uniref:hypothetical protein n=2 Tax=Tenacibaculum piscium TaxID=1458515 RepID=UPI001F3D39CB|nr:hypothetical protein [Tenacibaculum piscium]